MISPVAVNAFALQLSAQVTAFQEADAIIDHAEMVRFKNANKKGFDGLIKSQGGD